MKCMTEEQYEAMALLAGKAPMNVSVAALAVVNEAARQGLVLTVEQVPLQPLAMGRYKTVVTVREARVTPAGGDPVERAAA